MVLFFLGAATARDLGSGERWSLIRELWRRGEKGEEGQVGGLVHLASSLIQLIQNVGIKCGNDIKRNQIVCIIMQYEHLVFTWEKTI